MKVNYKFFKSSTQSWESMFKEAAAFATQVGIDRLIGISHSHGGGGDLFGAGGVGVITVWYWDQEEESE